WKVDLVQRTRSGLLNADCRESKKAPAAWVYPTCKISDSLVRRGELVRAPCEQTQRLRRHSGNASLFAEHKKAQTQSLRSRHQSELLRCLETPLIAVLSSTGFDLVVIGRARF